MHKLIYAEAEGREPRILPCVNVRLAPELPSISAGGKETQAIRARSINLNVTNQWHMRATAAAQQDTERPCQTRRQRPTAEFIT